MVYNFYTTKTMKCIRRGFCAEKTLLSKHLSNLHHLSKMLQNQRSHVVREIEIHESTANAIAGTTISGTELSVDLDDLYYKLGRIEYDMADTITEIDYILSDLNELNLGDVNTNLRLFESRNCQNDKSNLYDESDEDVPTPYCKGFSDGWNHAVDYIKYDLDVDIDLNEEKEDVHCYQKVTKNAKKHD